MTAVLDEMVVIAPEVLARLRARIDDSGGPTSCHPWTGARSAGGYGQLRVDGRVVYAHRWILGAHRGLPLRSDELALHTCDNPPCCNPTHLYVGDQSRNMRDCVEHGRANLDGLEIGRRLGKTRGAYRTGTELCGSIRGYSRHLRHGEQTCELCRRAINTYNRGRYNRVRGKS